MIGFFALSPYFSGDGEITPIFAKNLTVPSFADLSYPNDTAYENGKIVLRKRDNRPTFGGKMHKSPVTHFGENTVDTLYKFQFIALLSFYYCSQVGITTERTHRCYGDWWNSSHPVGYYSIW